MKLGYICALAIGLVPALAPAQDPTQGPAEDNVELMDQRLLVHLMVDELELRDMPGENDLDWDMSLSVGGDLDRFVFKSRGQRSDNEGDFSEAQFLYSRAVLPFWDLRTGFRRDDGTVNDRNWAVISINGLAPYYYDVEAELMLAEGGQSSLRVSGEYELLLTQRLILAPELELVAHGRAEPARLIGSGLGEVELGIRLRYEVRRELAPYVGLIRHRLLGSSRDLAATAGRDSDDTVLLVGLKAWF